MYIITGQKEPKKIGVSITYLSWPFDSLAF
jgi:hypothetical protein